MTNDEVLAGLIMGATAEREAGFEGWVSPPDHLRAQLDELVREGLAEMNASTDEPLTYFRPTPAGIEACSIAIRRVN